MFCHRRHTSTAIALTIALAAAAPPAASARYAPDPPPATVQTQAPGAVNPYSREAANPAVRAIDAQATRVAGELPARDAVASSATPSVPAPLIVKVSSPTGFVWGDAGIGAGAIFGLMLVLVGSTLYVTHRRTARASQAR